MITIGTTSFDFQTDNEAFARELYARWDSFCRSSFEQVAGRILALYDRPGELLAVDRLVLNLGELDEAVFYEQFPVRLAEKLKEAMIACTRQENGRRPSVSGTAGRHHRLEYYLLHGYLPCEASRPGNSLPELVAERLGENDGALSAFLLREGYRKELRQRLILQLADPALEGLVRATESKEPAFTVAYTRFLIASHPRLQRPEIERNHYRHVVWEVVLAYVWHRSRGYTDRKLLVRNTLEKLAAHYGLHPEALPVLLTTGVEKVVADTGVTGELLILLEEIRQENEAVGNNTTQAGALIPEQRAWTPEQLKAWTGTDGNTAGTNAVTGPDGGEPVKKLLERLAQPISCRRLLQPLTEEEIGRLAERVFPGIAPALIDYARQLEREKEKQLFEGKAGSEFRLVKWEFIFRVTLHRPAGALDLKYLVTGVLHQLSVHYGLTYEKLLLFFSREENTLPVWLRSVLNEVLTDTWGERLSGRIPSFFRKHATAEALLPGKREGSLRVLLSHPASCRRLLGKLSEEERGQLAGALFPAESRFITVYAGQLDRANEQGAFEGKAGNDFRLVKWEFIFLVRLGQAFNRRTFVWSVLQQLAAHYGLEVKKLLRYFAGELDASQPFLPDELAGIIRALWQETADGRLRTDSPLRTAAREEMRLGTVRSFFRTGYPGSGEAAGTERTGRPGDWFLRMADKNPATAEMLLREEASAADPEKFVYRRETARLYAVALRWWLQRQSRRSAAIDTMIRRLDDIIREKTDVSPVQLHRLLVRFVATGKQSDTNRIAEEALASDAASFLPDTPTSGISWQPADLPFLLQLLAGFRQPAVRVFLKKHRKALSRLLFSPAYRPEIEKRIRLTAGLAAFLYDLYQEEERHRETTGSWLQLPLFRFLPGKIQEKIMRTEAAPGHPAGRAVPSASGAPAGDARINECCDLLFRKLSAPEAEVVCRKLLYEAPEYVRRYVAADPVVRRLVPRLLSRTSAAFQWVWIERTGSVALRKAAGEIVRLDKQLPFTAGNGFIRRRLLGFTLPAYADLSFREIIMWFYTEWFDGLDPSQRLRIVEINEEYPQAFPGLNEFLRTSRHLIFNPSSAAGNNRQTNRPACPEQPQKQKNATGVSYPAAAGKTERSEPPGSGGEQEKITLRGAPPPAATPAGNAPEKRTSLAAEMAAAGKRVERIRQQNRPPVANKRPEAALLAGSSAAATANNPPFYSSNEAVKALKVRDDSPNDPPSYSSDEPPFSLFEKYPAAATLPGDLPVAVRNAGLVLLSPWYPRLFSLLELTQGNAFVSDEARIKAIFLLQSLVDNDPEAEFEETDLLLNKLLTGYMPGWPLPRRAELTVRERETAASMLEGARLNWEKTARTSTVGFRNSFVIREGFLVEEETGWRLKVTPRGYDLLLDSLPWSFGMIRYPWMEKLLTVSWRTSIG